MGHEAYANSEGLFKKNSTKLQYRITCRPQAGALPVLVVGLGVMSPGSFSFLINPQVPRLSFPVQVWTQPSPLGPGLVREVRAGTPPSWQKAGQVGPQ